MNKDEITYEGKIFAVRTTTGQEKNVARQASIKAEMNGIPIKAILVTENLRGYILIHPLG